MTISKTIKTIKSIRAEGRFHLAPVQEVAKKGDATPVGDRQPLIVAQAPTMPKPVRHRLIKAVAPGVPFKVDAPVGPIREAMKSTVEDS